MIAKSQNSIFDTPTYIALLLSLFSTHLLRTSDYTRYHDLSKKTMRNEFHSALHIFQDHNDFGVYVEIYPKRLTIYPNFNISLANKNVNKLYCHYCQDIS